MTITKCVHDGYHRDAMELSYCLRDRLEAAERVVEVLGRELEHYEVASEIETLKARAVLGEVR